MDGYQYPYYQTPPPPVPPPPPGTTLHALPPVVVQPLPIPQYHQPHHPSAPPLYPQDSHEDVRTLFIAGLPEDVKPREIYNLFREFAGYESSHLRSQTSSNSQRMNNWRTKGLRRGGVAARGNQNPPQAPAEGVAIPVNPAGLIDAEVRASLAQMAQAITMQAHAMTAQVNRQNARREIPPVCSMADRLRDFTRMNPPIFTGAKTSEDPQEFVDEVHKILVAMGATDIEKVELASYQLKDVAQTWCKMWQDSRVLGRVPVTWELFKTTFLERFFPREMREAKLEEFINLKQGSMTVREYSLKFVKLSRYVTFPNI
ncbi:uncharacterized protein LOC107018809 [Solanum pennellii]|uniref:Uncharacterized protein LOC107018809 n=1 Tax=Solanum pennellii TaxID=28526 RepID=A0ABM1VAE9_SOLPN|nr:uncharacterized protein LOC107018809 [Solanum pennellii]